LLKRLNMSNEPKQTAQRSKEARGQPGLEVHLGDGQGPATRRRRHERSDVRALVVWDHRGREGDTGTILDISASGMLLTGACGIPDGVRVGDVVWGRFRVEDVEHPFSAIVRWRGWAPRHRCDGLGVEFSELTPLARKDLEAFIAGSAPAPR
jgi:hypothetical protein